MNILEITDDEKFIILEALNNFSDIAESLVDNDSDTDNIILDIKNLTNKIEKL